MKDQRVLLGIECGGTHSTAVTATMEGQTLQKVAAGPANLRLADDEQLRSVFNAIAASVSQPAAIGIGLAGCRDEKDRARVTGVLGQVWPQVPTVVTHDLETAWRAADGTRRSLADRVVVVAGTGSCAYGKKGTGEEVRIGGWGHWLGDRGSAYDVAHRALRNAITQWDRQGQWRAFGASVLRRLMLNAPDDLVGWAQSASKTEVALLAVDAFETLSLDPAAKQAIRDCALALAADAVVCMRRIGRRGGAKEFVLAGGLFGHRKVYAALVAKELRRDFPKCRVAALTQPGAWGAVLMARDLAASGASQAVVGERGGSAKASQRDWSSRVPRSREMSPTERRNPRSLHLDQMPVEEAIHLMLSEDERVPGILLAQKRDMARLIRQTAKAFAAGGRLFYVGAGTSGRLGILDASECPPTFRTPPDWVQGIIAGGEKALHSAVEGAEDDFEGGAAAIGFRQVGSADVVLGIAASGRTPFVWGALEAARSAGAFTGLLCFNPFLEVGRVERPDLLFAFDVGPEILTGSTRLKAGTATKLFLNCVTTLAMVRLGKVVGNLMVDLNPSNLKLRDRAARIVMELCKCSQAQAIEALESANWVVKDAMAHFRHDG